MSKIVVFVVGQPEVGKTAISNHLADLSESLNSTEYHPTEGVRILEFDRTLVADPKKGQKWKDIVIEVELWDCSGNPKYMDTFKTLPVDAVLYVTPNQDGRQEKELDSWQELFPLLKPAQQTVFAHKIIASPQKHKLKITNKVLSKVHLVYTCLDQDPELLKSEFDNLLSNTYTHMLQGIAA